MRNEFVAVRVYQAVKSPATPVEFAADFSFMPELTVCTLPGLLLKISHASLSVYTMFENDVHLLQDSLTVIFQIAC